MTTQIEEILESIGEDNYFEDEAVILKTYITRSEAKIQELETRVKDSDDNCFELSQHIKELESIIKAKDVIIESMAQGKSCKNCYHSTIFSDKYRTCPCVSLIDEDGEPTDIVPNEFLCSLFHPKENQDVKENKNV